MSEPIWSPTAAQVEAANLTAFMQSVRSTEGVDVTEFSELHGWSVRDPAAFWGKIWNWCGVVASERGDRVLEHPDRMPGARWFPNARLNYAENLLRRRDDAPALIFWGENQVRRSLTFRELADRVARLSHALRSAGIGPGDRVAGYLPNIPEAVVAMLAATSLGAIWSSCSPDFGIQGVLDRFSQISPRVLFSVGCYCYKGKHVDCHERLAEIMNGLPTVERLIVLPYPHDELHTSHAPNGVSVSAFLDEHPGSELEFAQLPFDHPLYIMYSSGTTGVPKCIVHGAGGTLLQHLKEHRLHCDVRRDDRVFYYTTTGWMMWNWLLSALASEATVLLFDGNPFWPRRRILFDFAEREQMTFFGTSAKYIDAAKKAGLEPASTHDLSALRAIASTGSPLSAESFDYVYSKIKEDVLLASISGGTDIISCFVLGNPIGPVWRGEIQTPGLGMSVEVFDDDGNAVTEEKGELVCTRPFPSMPTGFWNDEDGARYRSAYFERFDGVWCHGDYVELTRNGGMIIYGRSDAVLNPGGVRIGTAEIYRQVERLDEVEESIAVGQDWRDDVRIILFVKLREGVELTPALVDSMKLHIRQNATPRHVPAKILAVPDIPRTKSGKIVELAVRHTIHGRAVKNTEALANPEALAHYRDRPELQT